MCTCKKCFKSNTSLYTDDALIEFTLIVFGKLNQVFPVIMFYKI